jgi:hypothetical protein
MYWFVYLFASSSLIHSIPKAGEEDTSIRRDKRCLEHDYLEKATMDMER